MKVRTLSVAAVVSLVLGLAPHPTLASDHVDGDVTKGHPISDISDLYAFPTPGKPGWLTLVLNVHPFAVEKNHFSEKVNYRFVLREAVADTKQRRARTDGKSERILRCTFNDRANPHTMTCTAPRGMSRTVLFNKTDSKPRNGMRLFAGHRTDSFFFSGTWAAITAGKGVIAPAEHGGKNSMKGLNTLSIVVDLDVKRLFGKDVSLLAVVAESVNAKTGTRLDRVGRPEVTNVTMVAHEGDTDLRDGYNARSPFSQAHQAKHEYRERILKNIGYYDALDGKQQWTSEQAKRYADLIVDDYLLVDISKPAGKEGYFAIESALLNGQEHTTSGGRLLTDDIMDTLFTRLINNAQGDRISDGVDSPAIAPSTVFPYSAKPNHTLPAKKVALFVRNLSKIPSEAYKSHEDEHPRQGIVEQVKRPGHGHPHGQK